MNCLEGVRKLIVEEIQDGRHEDKLVGMAENEYIKGMCQ